MWGPPGGDKIWPMFRLTRKYFTLTLLISGLLTATAKAENRGDQISLSLDALGQGIFFQTPTETSSYGGFGGQVFLDWRPYRVISLGFGGQYAYYPMTSSFRLTSFDLGGRIFPAGAFSPQGEFYLQGGVGRMLIINPGNYPGHYHGYAGLGWRQFLGGDMALDLGGQYDFFSPIGLPLNGASAKLGLTFLFGRDDWSEPKASRMMRPRTLSIGADWRGPSTFTWTKEKDLRTVAFEIYGDEGLYPLIVDANKDLIARAGLRPGEVLNIPPPPKTAGEVDRVEDLAFSNYRYMEWEQKSEGIIPQPFNPGVTTYRWKEKDNLASLAQRLYGDEDLYPLIVQANEDRLIRPDNLVAGKVLKIPRLPADNLLDGVRDEALNDPHYLWWRNVSMEEKEDIVPMHMQAPADDEP